MFASARKERAQTVGKCAKDDSKPMHTNVKANIIRNSLRISFNLCFIYVSLCVAQARHTSNHYWCRPIAPPASFAPGAISEQSWKSSPIVRQGLRLIYIDPYHVRRIPTMVDAGNQCPAWSPKRNRIAFSYRRYWVNPTIPTKFPAHADKRAGIWCVNVDGTAIHQLTHGYDQSPRWSPDGSRIVFSRYLDARRSQVDVYSVKTGSVIAVTPSSKQAYDPDWSPDGKTIAYTLVGRTCSKVWLQNVASGRCRILTDQPRGKCDFGRWSPDGKWLLFVNQSDNWYSGSLYRMHLDGHARYRLHCARVLADEPASWSPDGNRIAYVAYTAREAVAIRTCDPNGRNVQQVSPPAGVFDNTDYWPDW
jgi:Tol biopolymer transport system component